MKIKALISFAILSCAMVSCSKDDDKFTPPEISGLGVIHASPTTEKLDFYVESTKANTSDFAYTNKIDYLNLYSGSRKLVVTKKGVGVSTPLLSENVTLEAQKGYSLFIYDRFDALKFLLLKDDLTAPASNKAKVRFVHLSPDAAALNLGIAGKDTDLFTDKAFKASTDFVNIDPAEKVTFNIKKKTDNTVVATLADVKIESGKIYTIWVKGLAAAADDTKLGAVIYTHQ